jgi:hypothetical protein
MNERESVMNKKPWQIFLLLVGLLALGASWYLGYGMGKQAHYDAKEADRKAQVECLKAIYNSSKPHGRSEMTLEVYREVKRLEQDPEPSAQLGPYRCALVSSHNSAAVSRSDRAG